nr:TonB-dependent receptor plug domain-containing protein [Parasutterella excrementihominis]
MTAIAASVLATVTYPSVQAQETPSNSEKVVTAPVVVTATRTEKKLNEAPSSLVVITDGQLEQDNPKTLGDALLDIPNVMMEAPDSPIFTRISIRGSDSDQITYLIDGVRQDNYTMSGNRPAFMFVDPEMIKQIEVRRGGGSSLYGNGGIGGTIAVTTKTAADLLKPGRDFGAKLKAGYNNDADEFGQAAWLPTAKGLKLLETLNTIHLHLNSVLPLRMILFSRSVITTMRTSWIRVAQIMKLNTVSNSTD